MERGAALRAAPPPRTAVEPRAITLRQPVGGRLLGVPRRRLYGRRLELLEP